MSTEFDVSICHSSKDNVIAAQILKGLIVRGVSVWLDPNPLVYGVTPVALVEELASTPTTLY